MNWLPSSISKPIFPNSKVSIFPSKICYGTEKDSSNPTSNPLYDSAPKWPAYSLVRTCPHAEASILRPSCLRSRLELKQRDGQENNAFPAIGRPWRRRVPSPLLPVFLAIPPSLLCHTPSPFAAASQAWTFSGAGLRDIHRESKVSR